MTQINNRDISCTIEGVRWNFQLPPEVQHVRACTDEIVTWLEDAETNKRYYGKEANG